MLRTFHLREDFIILYFILIFWFWFEDHRLVLFIWLQSPKESYLEIILVCYFVVFFIEIQHYFGVFFLHLQWFKHIVIFLYWPLSWIVRELNFWLIMAIFSKNYLEFQLCFMQDSWFVWREITSVFKGAV